MPFRWEFDRPGAPFRRRFLKRRIRELKDLRWLFDKTMPEVAKVHAKHFNTEGSESRTGWGNGWLPLSQMAAMMRERRSGYYSRASSEGSEHKILHWTHSLRNSFASQHGTSDSIRRTFRRKMEFGSRHPLASRHHFGEDGRPVRYLLAEEASRDAVVKAATRILYRRWS